MYIGPAHAYTVAAFCVCTCFCVYVNVFVDIESFEIKCQTEGTCVRDVVYVIQQTKQFNSDSNTFQMYACLCVDGVRLGMYEMHNTECVCVFLPMFFYRGIVS